MSIEAVKERLSGVKPYRPSPYVEQLSEKTGINPCDILKLDANENLFLSKHFMQQVMIEASYETDPRLYPERETDYLREQIAQVKRAYKSIYREGRSLDEAKTILAEMASEHPEIKPLADFLAVAERGIIR